MDDYISKIDQRLTGLLSICHEPKLIEVMSYTVLGPGKRLRHQLLFITSDPLSGGYSSTALDFACAIEMIHAYSLVHDDLPAMDNDDFRRGRPTCHKAFDEALAILAGDGLLSLAMEVMAGHICGNDVEESLQAAKALNCIVKSAGINGMVAGQVSDILNEGKAITPEILAAIHCRKTGSLITACFEAGAIFGGAIEITKLNIIKLGNIVGLAFQIWDDILDVTSTEENLGKPIGSDSKNNKNTYVSVHGLEAAEAEYKNLCSEAVDLLSVIPCKTDALYDLVSKTLSRMK